MTYNDDARAEAVFNGDRNRQFLGLILSVAMILVFAAIGIVMMYSSPPRRSSAHANVCHGHLREIMIALHNYHDVFNSFPPAYTVDADGTPLHSWRTLILPFLGYDRVYGDIKLDEPWDSDYNRQFHRWMPQEYACPVDSGAALNYTSYMWIVGPNTISDGPTPNSIISAIRGTSNTVGVVEVIPTTCWMEPKDIPEADLAKGINHSPTEGIGNKHVPVGINVAMLDGSIRHLSNGDHAFLEINCQLDNKAPETAKESPEDVLKE